MALKRGRPAANLLDLASEDGMDGSSLSEDEVVIEDPPPEQSSTPAMQRTRLRVKTQTTAFGPPMRRSELAGRKFGLQAKHYRRLKRLRAPVIMWQLLWYIATAMEPGRVQQDVQCIEYYAGVGRVAKAFATAGLQSLTYAVNDDPLCQDFLSPQGMITATTYAMRLVRGGLAHWGTVCSSWVWISRSTTGRSAENIQGYRDRLPVSQGNRMVARMRLLLVLLSCRGVAGILEQPASSIMHMYPRLKALSSMLYEARAWMGSYGAHTLKPTALRSNKPWVAALARSVTPDVCARCSSMKVVTVSASGGVTGIKKALKSTQEYPVNYAAAALQAYLDNKDDAATSSSSESDYNDDRLSDDWSDVDLPDLQAMIGLERGQMPPGF